MNTEIYQLLFRTRQRILLLFRSLLIGIAITGLVMSPKLVGASSYSIHIQGDCYSSIPKAASWLYWEGQASSANGQTTAVLAYWSGSSWIDQTGGNSLQYGSTNMALVNNQAVYRTATWQQRASHAATFFTGVQTRYFNFTCP